MMLSQVSPLVVAMVEESHEKINHWVVGGLAFLILISLLGALIVFGGGREHS